MIKISIITPTLNQAKFLPETIDSVLVQNYKELQFIIIDGGSTDDTKKILKNKKDITWLSEKDNGQAAAINKGLKMATGDIVGYLNSDDILMPGTLQKLNHFFSNNSNYFWVTGKCHIIDEKSQVIRSAITSYKNFWLSHCRSFIILKILNFISQPSTFWRRKALRKIGYFNEALHFTMDYDYWLRLMSTYKLGYIDDYLAYFRIHPNSKSTKNLNNLFDEGYNTVKHYSNWPTSAMHRLHDSLITSIYHGLYY